jgi:hypothetical protein
MFSIDTANAELSASAIFRNSPLQLAFLCPNYSNAPVPSWGSFEVALIQCEDCGRDVSDRAPACLNCGAPIASADDKNAPEKVTVAGECFIGTRAQVVRLAVKAVQACNYKVDSTDETSGLVAFTTGMTMGSWSGVSGSIYFEEVGQYQFQASGNAKQNVKGGQVVALDLFGEAKSKVRKILEQMRYMTQ